MPAQRQLKSQKNQGGPAKKGSGLQRKFGGKTGIRKKTAKGYVIVPRANGSSGSKAKVSYERGQNTPYQTKGLPGQYKVQLPPAYLRGDSNALLERDLRQGR